MYYIFSQKTYKFVFFLILNIMVCSMISPDSLTLYIKPTCPYCVKVTKFMDQNDVTIKTKDVSDPIIRDELIAIGGKKQVPCLVHDQTALYESDDIIMWIKEHLLNKQVS